MANTLLKNAVSRQSLLDASAKKIVLSGPSGFLGSRVLDSILKVHSLRQEHGISPGEVILLSGSPGTLMERLYRQYGAEKMKTVRASRIDYYTQHDVESWIDQLGSLGAEGDHCVFVNLAAIAGPIPGKPNAMMDINYKAPAAAAKACEFLSFGHFLQSSTQATNAERAGQVPYSKGKAMMDFALARCKTMPVSIACLGLLYSKEDGTIGQGRTHARINLIDLCLLPLTPIMGDGSAPLQPQEVTDASDRLAFLALTDPSLRPKHQIENTNNSHGGRNDRLALVKRCNPDTFRYYDAVGPETMSMLDMLRKFAELQGNHNFRPVFVGYRNMEKMLNIRSLGNLNRQFVSLLRSEQDVANPVIGDSSCWEKVLGEHGKLLSLDEAFAANPSKAMGRSFPYFDLVKYVASSPKVVLPGAMLSVEILSSFGKSLVARGRMGRSASESNKQR